MTPTACAMSSPAVDFVREVARLGPRAPAALERLLASMSVIELAATWHDFRGFWARPKQVIPHSKWRSHGFLTARRFGKTKANAEFVIGEAESERAMRIGFMAQNIEKTLEVMVEGECGLIACSPPWFKPIYESDRVIWPNGAQAFPFSPERPGNIRGQGVHLMWMSELQSWPAAHRQEAFFSCAGPMTSLGYAKTVWDATPKRRHPIIRQLRTRAAEQPDLHIIVSGLIEENAINLGAGVIDDLRASIGGTQAGREELDGEYSDDDDGALWKQAWIEDNRRFRPTEFKRRILSIDPAISERAYSDETGFVDLGLGIDDQVLVLDDFSGKHAWEAWGEKACKLYVENRCDCIVIERNRGGDACAANIRAQAMRIGLRVEMLKLEAVTRWTPGVIYLKEAKSGDRSKEARAMPVAGLTKNGRVSFVRDRDFTTLEELLTTWDPTVSRESPDPLDAMVYGVYELLNLWGKEDDYSAGFEGILKAAEELAKATAPERLASGGGLLAVLGRSEWGGEGL